MNTEPTVSAAPPSPGGLPGATDNFSLVLGGPLFQLLRRARLTDDALSLQRRRVIVLSLLAWLPLLVLSAAGGRLLPGSTAVPFIMDVEVHIRFLAAMPLLILAELIVHQRMRAVVTTFRNRRLVPEHAAAQLDTAVESAFRLRNSVLAESVLMAFVYVVGITIVWRQYMALDAATWYATPSAGGSTLTLAGFWYGYVSLPVFQFLLIRWYFRIFIWARLLWQVSRIELNLVPTHPDRVGGLGFLGSTVHAFVPLLLAHGTLLAGNLANQIFYLGARLPEFRLEIFLVVIYLLCLVVGPMLVFSPQIARTKRMGLREYGTLAQQYVRDFDTKWVRGGAAKDEQMLGTGDIQSLADLGNSFAVVQSMRLVPVSRDGIVQLAVATVIPLVPLLLTMMPLDELLKKLAGVIF